ncbi:MAG: biotin--[Stomatobaculum sp.]|nr:biotin--[acetyl-CoA-carboxylase] ligase [Stomatobaculum sp.]
MKDDILVELKNRGDYCSGQELCGRFGVTRTAVWKAVTKLKEEGYNIEARKNRGYRILSGDDVMNEAELRRALEGNGFLKESLFFQEIDSTNLEVKRRAEAGAEAPLLVAADTQTAGRGRRGRNWISPPGTDIYMSLLLRPAIRPEHASMLTIVAALAVACGIREETGLEAGIKWPNDAVVDGKKICGILTEMSTDMEEISYVVPGIGINVNSDSFPPEIAATATSLKLCLGRTVNRAGVIAAVIRCFAEYYEIFLRTEDLSGLKELYESMLVNRGREVLVLDPKGEYRGTARGITSSGELLVVREDGTEAKVLSGEVSVRGVYGYV